MKVNFYLDVGELTGRTLAKRLRTLANRPKTLANETLAKRPDTLVYIRLSIAIARNIKFTGSS